MLTGILAESNCLMLLGICNCELLLHPRSFFGRVLQSLSLLVNIRISRYKTLFFRQISGLFVQASLDFVQLGHACFEHQFALVLFLHRLKGQFLAWSQLVDILEAMLNHAGRLCSRLLLKQAWWSCTVFRRCCTRCVLIIVSYLLRIDCLARTICNLYRQLLLLGDLMVYLGVWALRGLWSACHGVIRVIIAFRIRISEVACTAFIDKLFILNRKAGWWN